MSSRNRKIRLVPPASGRRAHVQNAELTITHEHTDVLDAFEEGVLVLDRNGALVEANAAALSILDAETAAMAQLTAQPVGAAGVEARVIVRRTGAGVRNVEVQVDRQDGTHVLLSVDYLPSAQGRQGHRRSDRLPRNPQIVHIGQRYTLRRRNVAGRHRSGGDL